jgi:hypothetical protein
MHRFVSEGLLVVAIGLLLPACTPDVPPDPAPHPATADPYRPQYHYTPPRFGMNDPNGR